MDNQVQAILITYKDRFIRFGFDWFNRLCKAHGTEIVVLNKPDTSPNKELVDDLVSIIHVFSCRLYGLRKYKRHLQNDESLNGGKDNDSDRESSLISQQKHEKRS